MSSAPNVLRSTPSDRRRRWTGLGTTSSYHFRSQSAGKAPLARRFPTRSEMSEMPNLTSKEIPEQLLAQLRRRAAHRRHSINREVILCLGRATELPVLEPSRWLADADRLRASLDLPPLIAQVLRRGSAKGRPGTSRVPLDVETIQPWSATHTELSLLRHLACMHGSAILMHMGTTLNIDDALLLQAAKLTGVSEKTSLVRMGLEALVAAASARRLAVLGGSEPRLRPVPRRRAGQAT